MSKKRKQEKDTRLDLKFGPGDLSGFTAAGLTGFHALNPAAVVRELLQNSLDAARDAGRKLAKIRFEIEKHPMRLVPGIETYRSAFQQAVDDQKKLLGTLPDTAISIVNAMQSCSGKNECTTLFVLDNGIGLDKKRMQGLLGDGLSVKSNESAGSVGNGHLTIIPASDLRYVLYGGRTENGDCIGSGHAVLASHQPDGERIRSKDGFYVKELTDDLFDRYVFPENDEVPDYIDAKLQWIETNWSTGTVVAVPGFNRFREDEKSLWDMLSKAAACNFFAAFAEGELRVEFREDGDEKILDKSNIASTLEQFSTEKRTRGGFLSSSRALTAFETIRTGKDITVDTPIGRISMRWRLLAKDGLSRVELCRNGMWISADLPRLGRNRLTNLKPFHCLILLEAEAGKIHRLVRKAEGPLHNSLEARKWLSKDEKSKLERAMNAVFEALKAKVPSVENETSFWIDDVFTINVDGGEFEEVPRRSRFRREDERSHTKDGTEVVTLPKKMNGQDGSNRSKSGTFRRSGNAIPFSACPVPVGKRSYWIDLIPGEKRTGSELRFALDESMDESCDTFGLETFVRLKNVKMEGRLIPEDMLTHDEEDQALGIRLGALDPKKTIRIEFDYGLPTGIDLPPDAPVVLNMQLIGRSPNSENRVDA